MRISISVLWLAALLLSIGCASPASTTAEPESTGSETASNSEEDTNAPPNGAPSGTVAASAPCAAYLTHYQRCETQLSAEIASGDRRAFSAEEGWIHFMEESAEGPGMPSACRDMDVELGAVCP